jgi:hypothetical protein
MVALRLTGSDPRTAQHEEQHNTLFSAMMERDGTIGFLVWETMRPRAAACSLPADSAGRGLPRLITSVATRSDASANDSLNEMIRIMTQTG